MQGHYPKYLFKKNDKGELIDKLVATEDAHLALEEKEPGVWAESPELIGEDGKAIHVDDAEEAPEVPIPGVTPGAGDAYPKWLYHADGKREQVVHSKEAHDALVDKADWHESPDLSAGLQSNSVANAAPAGESLWETPVRDVLEMVKGSSLMVLEKTYTLEEQNPHGPRKTLQRELADLIETAQKASNADVDE